jgi:hypothetical protein
MQPCGCAAASEHPPGRAAAATAALGACDWTDAFALMVWGRLVLASLRAGCDGVAARRSGCRAPPRAAAPPAAAAAAAVAWTASWPQCPRRLSRRDDEGALQRRCRCQVSTDPGWTLKPAPPLCDAAPSAETSSATRASAAEASWNAAVPCPSAALAAVATLRAQRGRRRAAASAATVGGCPAADHGGSWLLASAPGSRPGRAAAPVR